MYARSPRMDTLHVPTTRHPIKIQPMDASFTVVSDDDEECGLGYQNTLVTKQFIHSKYRIPLKQMNGFRFIHSKQCIWNTWNFLQKKNMYICNQSSGFVALLRRNSISYILWPSKCNSCYYITVFLLYISVDCVKTVRNKTGDELIYRCW